MRNSHLPFEDFKKTTMHFKRYSEHDLKTSSINNLLITQSNAFSHLKFKSLRTKLPQITSTTQSFPRSHFKIDRITEAVEGLGSEASQLRSDAEDLTAAFSAQRTAMEDRFEKTNNALTSKVERLSKMLQYAINEDRNRTKRIENNCNTLKESTQDLKNKIEDIRSRVKRLQDELGVYTGEDKYLL